MSLFMCLSTEVFDLLFTQFLFIYCIKKMNVRNIFILFSEVLQVYLPLEKSIDDKLSNSTSTRC